MRNVYVCQIHIILPFAPNQGKALPPFEVRKADWPSTTLGYARTSFGVDAAAEVTISKCNLWKFWTLEMTSEFPTHILLFLSQGGMRVGFIKTMQAKNPLTTFQKMFIENIFKPSFL